MPFSRIITILFLMFLGILSASCAQKPIVREQPLTVAVWPLEDHSVSTARGPNLEEQLWAEIMNALKQRGDYVLVERERLDLALRELGLGTTWLVDESTRLRVGRIVGARRMIFGGYVVTREQMRLDLQLVDVETSLHLKAVKKETAADDYQGWLEAAKQAALEM